jgi:hypothetical protein
VSTPSYPAMGSDSSRSRMFRVPKREDVPAWVVVALLSGGAGVFGSKAIASPPSPAPMVQPAQDNSDLRTLVMQHERILAQHAEQIAAITIAVAGIPDIGHRTEKLEKGMHLIQRNELVVCRSVARLAHQPNECREEAE